MVTVLNAVFQVRYLESRLTGAGWPRDFRRKAGTVDGECVNGGVPPKPDCSIAEACKCLEHDLKNEREDRLKYAGLSDFQRWPPPALIARRRSDGWAPEGAATRQVVYRALRIERAWLAWFESPEGKAWVARFQSPGGKRSPAD